MSDFNSVAIVDDDEAIVDAMSSFVRSLGYDVRTFPSAEAFLHSGSIETIGCLISDIQMPVMDGFTLQAHLRQRHPNLPIVMMTSLAAAPLEGRALAGGAHSFFRKPIPGQDLADCLAAIFAA